MSRAKASNTSKALEELKAEEGSLLRPHKFAERCEYEALLTEHAGALLAVPPQKLYGRDLSLGLEHAPSTTSQHAYASEHSQPLPFALPATAASCCFLLDFFALGLALGLAAGVEGAAALEPAAVAGAPLPGTMGCTPCLHTHMTSPVSLQGEGGRVRGRGKG